MMANEEEYLHIRTCNYLRTNYPGVPFNSDMSGFKVGKRLAGIAKQLRSQRGWPDLFIPEPRRGFAGLYIEIKTNRDEIYTKKGELRQSKHIQEQAEMLAILRKRGFYAEFACGDSEVRELIDWYLEEKPLIESTVTARFNGLVCICDPPEPIKGPHHETDCKMWDTVFGWD